MAGGVLLWRIYARSSASPRKRSCSASPPNLLQRVIKPAVLEVNGLADFGVEIDPIRKGGQRRGLVTGFRISWWKKDTPALQAAYHELKQPKVGRMARLKATAQKPLTSMAEKLL